jgi:Do/DeqQ family serine protease
MTRWLLPLLLALAGLQTAPHAAAQEDRRPPESQAEVTLSYAPVVKAAAPSVVNIYAQRVVAASPFAADPFYSQLFGGPRARPRVQNSLGSGVIVDETGIVVSNYHVVGGATDIRVVLPDRREYDATIILADPDTDLAVLQLVEAPALPALALADSDEVEVGDLVLAIGNPFGVGQTVSSGIISALARTSAIGGQAGYFIQTDAPINPGNSGGALVDMQGRLVGINSAIVSRSGGSNGIGFAIPANLVRQYVAQARAGRTEIAQPWGGLTVQPVDAGAAEALGLALPHGVLVTQLHPASPFAEAGLRVGDVITGIGGQPVDGGEELLFRLLALGIDTEASVTFLSDGTEHEESFTLALPPEDPPREVTRITARSVLNGLTLARANPALIAEMDLPFDTEGVVVVRVEGLAQRSRLRPGDVVRRVNGVVIERPADLAELAEQRVSGYEIEFLRGGQRILLRLRNR